MPVISGQRCAAPSRSSRQLTGLSKLPSCALVSSGFSVPYPAAARSRATPRTPRQSARFGVIAISITGSSSPAKAAKPAPMGASAASSMMPSCSSEIIISRSEQSMPFESWPRMLPAFSSSSIPGTQAPTGAKTPFMPARAFGAPHTTCTGSPLPVLTMQTRSLSASGCCSAEITSATVKGARRADGSSKALDLEAKHRQRLENLVERTVGVEMVEQPVTGEFHQTLPPARPAWTDGASNGRKP